jgi:hypothetical protein
VTAPAPQIDLPRLPNDYGKIWWDHVVGTGGDPRAHALKYYLYREAVAKFRSGEIQCPSHVDRVTAADAVERHVLNEFFRRGLKATPDANVYHQALQGALYEDAVERLRTGVLGIEGGAGAAAAIDLWVKREFVSRMTTATPSVSP